jgi:hypothetical protein
VMGKGNETEGGFLGPEDGRRRGVVGDMFGLVSRAGSFQSVGTVRYLFIASESSLTPSDRGARTKPARLCWVCDLMFLVM